MTFEIHHKKDYALVRVKTDRLDTNTAPGLKSELLVLHNKGEKNIVVDMRQCTYCDSSGLRAILVGNRLCEDALGAFIISGLQPDVENLIRISMLHTVLLISNSVDDAEGLLEKKEHL